MALLHGSGVRGCILRVVIIRDHRDLRLFAYRLWRPESHGGGNLNPSSCVLSFLSLSPYQDIHVTRVLAFTRLEPPFFLIQPKSGVPESPICQDCAYFNTASHARFLSHRLNDLASKDSRLYGFLFGTNLLQWLDILSINRFASPRFISCVYELSLFPVANQLSIPPPPICISYRILKQHP